MVVCEVARSMGRDIEDVLNDGYFKVHRTWDILNELRSRDLFEFSIAMLTPHLNDDARQQHFETLKELQPRRYPPASTFAMPPELAKEFAQGFNKAKLHGRRKQNRN
jgi:hypothetical protein